MGWRSLSFPDEVALQEPSTRGKDCDKNKSAIWKTKQKVQWDLGLQYVLGNQNWLFFYNLGVYQLEITKKGGEILNDNKISMNVTHYERD